MFLVFLAAGFAGLEVVLLLGGYSLSLGGRFVRGAPGIKAHLYCRYFTGRSVEWAVFSHGSISSRGLYSCPVLYSPAAAA